MVALIEQSALGEMFTERRVDPTVLAEAQPAIVQQRLGNMKHGVVRPGGGGLDVTFGHRALARRNGSASLLKQFGSGLVHGAMASSRTLRRKGESPANHSCRRTNT